MALAAYDGYCRGYVSFAHFLLYFGKGCCHFFSVVLDGSLFILTGNDDIHKGLDEFEIQPDPTTDHRDSCP